MKRSAILLCTALSLHAAAADETTRPATSVLDVLRAINGELRPLFPPNGNPATGLERMRSFQFSPATAAQLQSMFGTSQPVTVSEARRTKGRRTYEIGLHALDHTEPDGSRIESSPLNGQVQITQQGKRISGTAAWPSITVHEKDGDVRLSGLAMKFDQRRAVAGLWLGATTVSVREIDAQTPSGRFTMPGLAGGIQIRQRGKGIDIAYNLAFGTATQPMRVGSTEVGTMKLKLTLAGIPISSMIALRDAGDRLPAGGDAAARAEQMKPMFAALGRALIENGAVLRVDGLDLTRSHRTASLAGSLRVTPFADLDQATVPQVLRHVDARFKVRVPADMVVDIAQAVARQQMQTKSPGTPVSEDAVRQSAQTIADVMVGRLVNGGYAKVERGYIVTDVTFRDGVMRANGKVFELPENPPPRPADPEAVRHTAFMPPRRVAERCQLPPFPDEMLRDQPQYNWKFSLVIGADGRSHGVKLEQASAWPAYDAAINEAVEHCQWIPALIEGKEADFPSNWAIGRDENGEQHWELTGSGQ